ncbi:hypothetical protein LTR95_005896 [Oleoguttula sp. CCFEE 5521]
MRPQRYRNLEGSSAERDAVPWYWRVVAGIATLMILGGYLMLPATFDSDPLLRAPKTVIGIFAVALLTAGLSVTGLICFAVRNAAFQAESVFLPCTTACALGLLTVFYDFLISTRYAWNTPALLVTVASAVSTVVYGTLLIYTYRRVSKSRGPGPYVPPNMRTQPLDPAVPTGRSASLAYQAPGYYENYLANMYPTSAHPQTPPASGGVYDPNHITEEEMQRQQMLMLLLQRNQPPTPDPSQSTFHIEWQGQQEAEDTGHLTPVGGYYAPRHQQSSASGRSTQSRPTHSRQWSQQGMRPWDGVWRGVSTASGSSGEDSGITVVRGSQERREERRREIEMGGRR